MTFMHGQFYQFGAPFEVYVAETLSNFYKHMNPEKERVWIAELEDKIVGTIAVKNTHKQAQLRYFLIDPTCRGIGLGNKMMDLFMDFVQKCGYSSSFLLTEEKLETAAHLYSKYGYKYASSRETDIGLVELRYELDF